MRRILVLLLMALLLPLTSHAANYYVDIQSLGGTCSPANAGTSLTVPKCTIAQAFSIAGIGGGDTVHVRQGVYADIRSSTMVLPSGSASAPLVVTGYQNEKFEVRLIDITGFNTTFQTGTAYVTFKNFIVDGHNGGGGLSAQHPNVHHLTFQDGIVRRVKELGPPCSLGPPEVCPGASGSGFGAGAHHITFRNLEIYDNGLNRLDHGIYATGPDSVFENLSLHDNSGYGIQIYDGGCPSFPLGPACCDRCIFRHNRIYNNRGDGGVSLNHGLNMQVYNNLIYANNNGGLGVAGENVNGVQVVNNTIEGNGGTGLDVGRAVGNVVGATIKDNILWNHPNAIVPQGTPGVTFANNLCPALTYGCTHTGDPLFTSTASANYALQAGSAARNRVATSGGACATPTDFAQVARPQGSGGTPCDIGAYEYPEGGGLPPSGNPIYLSAGGHGDVPTDSGDCTVPETITTPRATLAGALACMQIPGKILYIRGGTYQGKINAWGGAMAGGIAADNPTRIEGYAAEAVTIELNENDIPALYVNGINYLTIAKLTFDAMNRANTNGLACGNSTNVKILNSTFKNSYFEAGFLDTCANVEVTQTTFQASAVSPVVALYGTIANVTFDQVAVSGGPLEGIKANVGSGSNSSLSILRTQIRGTGAGAGGAALDLGPGTGALVVNNIIDHNAAGIRVRAGANGVKVYHNAVASNTGVGIQCDAPARTGGDIVTISNNISFGNGTDPVVNNCAAMLAGLNLTTDPYWVNTATVPYDFQLQTAHVPPSPALDQLSTVLPEAQLAIDGTQRPVGFLADVGPYEQTAVTPEPPPTTVLPLLTRYLGMFY